MQDKVVKKQMQKTALLSYLLYEDGKIVIDEISPKDKFGKVFTNETKYHSQSVGKSFASYILGHAIYSKYPLINTHSFNFKDSYNNTIVADVIRGIDTIRVYNLHLQSFSI